MNIFPKLRKFPIWLRIQVALAIIALLVAIIVGTEIKPLLDKKTQLERNIVHLEEKTQELQKELSSVGKTLKAAREAVYFVTQGINLYHQGHYLDAVDAYDQALALDSLNGYILNLKGYSLFKARKLDLAEITLHRSVEVGPGYAWGYFDLARVYCANGKSLEARSAAKTAISLRPELAQVMKKDGEFVRLCQPILDVVNSPAKQD